ncbi:hypothetical protein SAY86_011956 [Trapa natans]|uniref:Histone deacetylase complex subunit SAP30 Sin3 binding domain-containing protein n=1 Tax=Trapa natans TaxID=22666 RepID=A0AAN7LWN5_TRANT|nr:hypothetical protein SAY86_011956 [Trapa natans]
MEEGRKGRADKCFFSRCSAGTWKSRREFLVRMKWIYKPIFGAVEKERELEPGAACECDYKQRTTSLARIRSDSLATGTCTSILPSPPSRLQLSFFQLYPCWKDFAAACEFRIIVLKNGVEVKLQRNALSVLEHPSGNEDDGDLDFYSSSGSDTVDNKDHDFSNAISFPKISKPRVRHTRPWSSSPTNSCKPMNRGMYRDVQSIIQSPHMRVNLAKLGADSLSKYCRYYKLVSVNSNTSREEMLSAVERHFLIHQQRLSEAQVIMNFVRAAKRMKSG